MLKDLKFVQGAVSKKNYQPALAHFRIKEGRVTGYNGTIALSSPITLDVDATPKAIPFVKAIERCETTTTIHLTASGRLSLRSGKFKTLIDCTEEIEILDSIQPEGTSVALAGQILPALQALQPFVGTDQSRPWATGVLLRGYSAYATNNIIVAEYWLGVPLPEVNLPSAAIDELLRIGEEPTQVLMSDRSMTFFFSNDRWMRTQLLGLDWPDLSVIFDNVQGDPKPFPEDFFEAIETLKPFVGEEGRIFFRGNLMATSHNHEHEGATVDILGLPTKGAFHFEHLLSLQDRASAIDFTTHPKPSPFYGNGMRGVIIGMVDV